METSSRTLRADTYMHFPPKEASSLPPQQGSLWRIEALRRREIEGDARWASTLASERKDRRYFEIVEDTIDQGLDYRYLAVKDETGEMRAVQPFFINDQDLLTGAGLRIEKFAQMVRRVFPRFLKMRTLMVGCAAGEGHLDAQDEASRAHLATSLGASLAAEARRLKASLIVFKEFTVADRPALSCLLEQGFTRIPSMPMTRVKLDFGSFEDYLRYTLSRNMRSKLRRKYKESEQKATLKMKMVVDITPYIDDVYPLYLNVYEKSTLRFEKLTPEYLCQLGQKMPDKTRFFLWFLEDRLVAFNLCLAASGAVCSEYIGFDYSVALDLHLYYIAIKDVMEWAIANNYQWYCSTALNYEPKFHLKHELYPLDLYIRHTSPALNLLMKRLSRYLGPVKSDKLLPRFSNYSDLFADAKAVIAHDVRC